LAATPKKIYIGTPPTGSGTTLYTVPSNTKLIVKNIVLCNTTATEAQINVNFAGVPLIQNYKVAPLDTVVVDLSLVLEAGDTITSMQYTSNAVKLAISGVEVA
jgi:hypothetical protein